jgi:hypothetical protein
MTSRVLTIAAMVVCSACAKPDTGTYQGYVEGEFVHVASGVGGRLERLFVVRGQAVDTLFREGEWVPSGASVVRMLPPANVKVRLFVPERALSAFAVGRQISIRCDGCQAPIAANGQLCLDAT